MFFPQEKIAALPLACRQFQWIVKPPEQGASFYVCGSRSLIDGSCCRWGVFNIATGGSRGRSGAGSHHRDIAMLSLIGSVAYGAGR